MQESLPFNLDRGDAERRPGEDTLGRHGSATQKSRPRRRTGERYTEPELPLEGGDRYRDAQTGERRDSPRTDLHLRRPFAVTDIRLNYTAWGRQKYYVVDSAGVMIGVFEDEKIARLVVELVNGSGRIQAQDR